MLLTGPPPTFAVAAGGYAWRDRNSAADRKAMAVLPEREWPSEGYRENYVLEPATAETEISPPAPPDLFLQLACVERTRDGIQAFASRWGLLSSTSPSSLYWWGIELGLLNHAIDLWVRAAPKEPDILRFRASFPIGGSGDALDWTFGLESGESRIGDMRKLADIFKETLLWHCRLTIELSTENSFALEVEEGLLPYCWAQLADAILTKQLRACAHCGKRFLISRAKQGARRSRADQDFCSKLCVTRSYRERQRRAKQLHAGGTPLRQIAKQLNSDVATVRGWVKTKGVK